MNHQIVWRVRSHSASHTRKRVFHSNFDCVSLGKAKRKLRGKRSSLEVGGYVLCPICANGGPLTGPQKAVGWEKYDMRRLQTPKGVPSV